MLEFYYSHMMYRTMNLNFTHKFLLSPALSQGGLLDHLGRQDALGLLVLKFIALREATLAQKFTFQVLPDLHFAIVFNYLLFYYSWLCTFHLYCFL